MPGKLFSGKGLHTTVTDMTEGVIWRHLVSFAFPLFVGTKAKPQRCGDAKL